VKFLLWNHCLDLAGRAARDERACGQALGPTVIHPSSGPNSRYIFSHIYIDARATLNAMAKFELKSNSKFE
jgi:hypothetical protein